MTTFRLTKRLTSDRRDLAERFIARWPQPGRLLKLFRPSLVRRALGLGFSFEDIDSLCGMAVVKMAAKFDTNHPSGAKFITAVKWTMRTEVNTAVKSELRRRRRLADLTAEDGERDPIQQLPDPIQVAELLTAHDLNNHTRKRLAEVLAEKVTKYRDREVFVRRYGLRDGQPLELADLAELFGLTPPAVAEIVVGVLLTCRDDLEELFLSLAG